MRTITLFSLALLAGVAFAGPASSELKAVPEFRPFVGAFLPTGDQRDVLEDALFVGGQVGAEVTPMLHVIGTFAWAPTENRRLASSRDVNLYQYDAGAELFRNFEMTSGWMLRPFFGAGLGARTYDHRDQDVGAKTYLAGYGSLGTEFQMERIALRLEARDYLSRFKGLAGGEESSTRNDISVSAGLSLHLW